MKFKENYEKIMRLAEKTLGNKENAKEWMSSPCEPLGYVKPIDLLETDEGTHEVENILGRIVHGVFS